MGLKYNPSLTQARILFFPSPKTAYTKLFQQLEYFSFV